MRLHNIYDNKKLFEDLSKEKSCRLTVSFYKYFTILNPKEFRDELYIHWAELKVLGRVYLANEGINAQISVPEENLELFKKSLDHWSIFKNIRLNFAIESKNYAFLKLTIKVRTKIVADGLDDQSFDTKNVGNHLKPEEFHQMLDYPNVVVVDLRNHYESEVGRFEGAICPDVDTFREEIPYTVDLLKEKKNQKLLLYCTGGIRCEKASAYFKHLGFQDVNQLEGGVVNYVNQIKKLGLKSKFIGKNFVFDDRMGEKVTDDIISECHICKTKSNRHTNCANKACHVLFIQCEECAKKLDNCCTPECKFTNQLSEEEQKKIRKENTKSNIQFFHNTRHRSNLKEYYKNKTI